MVLPDRREEKRRGAALDDDDDDFNGDKVKIMRTARKTNFLVENPTWKLDHDEERDVVVEVGE